MKMCDFGISGYLVDSVAKTMDAGCKPYMAVSGPLPPQGLGHGRGSGEDVPRDNYQIMSSVHQGRGLPETLHFLPQRGPLPRGLPK